MKEDSLVMDCSSIEIKVNAKLVTERWVEL